MLHATAKGQPRCTGSRGLVAQHNAQRLVAVSGVWGGVATAHRRAQLLAGRKTLARSHEDREAGPAHPPALHLSLFVPYKSLPPDGQVIPPEEEACDIQVQRCKTNAYVFETPCDACHGTGHARARHAARSGARARASLHTCLVCVGMGHVRRTTARAPLVRLHNADGPAGAGATTLARTQRLPGEPTQQHAAHEGGHQHHSQAEQRQPRQPKGLLKKAIELNEQRNKAAAAEAAAAGGTTPQNNIVSSAGLGGVAKKQQQQKTSGTAV